MKHAFPFTKGSPAMVGAKSQEGKIWSGYKMMVLVVVTLSLGQLIISNQLSTMGVRLAKVDEQSVGLAQENVVLESRLNRGLALSHVAEQGDFRSLMQSGVKVVFGSIRTQVALR